MLETLISFYILMAIVWAPVLFRNYFFKFIYALFGVSIHYVKNSKVDVGLLIMFFSFIAGITIFVLFPSTPVDVITILIALSGSVGAVVAALGWGDERRSNKGDK